jgi:hypothetical protein
MAVDCQTRNASSISELQDGVVMPNYFVMTDVELRASARVPNKVL